MNVCARLVFALAFSFAQLYWENFTKSDLCKKNGGSQACNPFSSPCPCLPGLVRADSARGASAPDGSGLRVEPIPDRFWFGAALALAEGVGALRP